MTYLTTFIQKIDYGLLIALIIPIFAILPLLAYAGLPNTADGPAHLMRQVELNQAWQQGNFYLRWGADLALGHGMPIFNYTPPLFYQITQLFHLTGLPLDESLKAIIILDFLLYSGGMFVFARRIYGPYPALLAAAIHIYAPYRLREAYIQGSYGQFNGLALYPIILWAFHGLITEGRRRYFIAASFSLAALLLSHNITALHFAPLLGVYLLFLLSLRWYHASRITHHASPLRHYTSLQSFLSKLGQVILASLLGLGLAAIYWLPAFAEQNYVQFEKITQGFFDFRHNFLTLAELVALPVPLDLAAINPEFPLSLGPAQWLAALAGILALLSILVKWLFSHYALRFTHHSYPNLDAPIAHTLFFAAFFLIFAALTLPISEPIWEIIPLLELTEFPWRLLGPAIFCASLLAAAAYFIITNYYLPITKEFTHLLIVNCSLLIVIFLNGYYLYPSQFIPWGNPTPADTFRYEITTGAIGTNSAAEMLPRWVQQPPQPDALWPDYEAGRLPQKVDPATLPSNATAKTVTHLAESYTVEINSPQTFVATLRTLYWPDWQLYLDGQPVPFNITPNTGLMQTTIPAGQHLLTAQLEPTPIRAVGRWLSILSAGVLLLIALKPTTTTGASPTNTPTQTTSNLIHNTQYAIRITYHAFLITAAVLVIAYLLSRPLTPFFTLQSNPNRPQPADHLLAVNFADQIRLVGADTLPQVIQLPATGETALEAVLYWRALQNLETHYAVFLHLDAPNGQTFATIDETNPEHIPSRVWPPGLYLRNPLQLDLPSDLPPIRYDLTTGVYNPHTGERLPIEPDGATVYPLGPVWLTQPPPETTPAAIASFGPNITLHQATFAANRLTLWWQTAQPITQNYTIFIHALDAQGNLIAQFDGAPYNGLYPLSNWLPQQVIKDIRLLDLPAPPASLAIGIYDPAGGQRLPAAGAGQPLPNDSFILTVSP
jgi:hypothetical protein